MPRRQLPLRAELSSTQACLTGAISKRPEEIRHGRLEGHILRISAIEWVQGGDRRRHVGQNARPGGGDAVLLARARAALPAGVAGGMPVAALRRVERVEAVTEDAGRVVRDERVLALPAGAVRRIERVEVDQAAEAVGRRAVARRAEPVDRPALVRVAAEELLEAVAPDPAHVQLELRELARPVRDLQPLLARLAVPRREAEVGERAAPALRGPVGAVGRLAGGDEVRQGRAVVAAARAGERRRVLRPPAPRVIHVELDLAGTGCREARVDRTPHEHPPQGPALSVREERLALRVGADRHPRCVPRDELRRLRRAHSRKGGYSGCSADTKTTHARQGALGRQWWLSPESGTSPSFTAPLKTSDGAGVAGVRPALDDVGKLLDRVAQLVLGVEEVRAQADAPTAAEGGGVFPAG